MKILCTTYYFDFARYFLYLQKELAKEAPGSLQIKHLCFYPSAYYYFRDHGIEATLLAEAVRDIKVDAMARILENNEYKGLNLDRCIHFNYVSQKMFGLDREKALKAQAVKYIEYYDRLFAEERFDLFISSGDTRMATEIALHFAGKYGVKTWYFEQGPYGTTMMDPVGVNCNISFAGRKELSYDGDNRKLDEFIHRYKTVKPVKFKGKAHPPLKYKLDLLYMYTPSLFRPFFPVDLQTGEKFFPKVIWQKLKRVYGRFVRKKVQKAVFPPKMVALILQVPVDAQMIVHSPNYRNFYDMVVDVYKNLPDGYNLVVREHPGNKGNYEKELYDFIDSKPKAYLINEGSLGEILEKAEVVVLNNSTVGMEALTFFKPVVTLGKAYYNRDGVVYHVDKRENLGQVIDKALVEGAREEEIRKFLYNFIFDYLYIGHFQDEKLQSGELIAKDVLASVDHS